VQLIEIDVGKKTTTEEQVTSEKEEAFLGGRGITTRVLHDSAEPGADPFGPFSPLIFGTGPLTGTPFPMAGRYNATGKSPLTNTVFTCSCGGRLGVYMKRCGIDILSVKGISGDPCYILIEEGSATVLPAGDLWGKEKRTVKETLRQRHGRDVSILIIGKAGEALVPYANIENDGRFLGRGGLGAILGAKKVKAIVARRGKRKTVIADREQFSFIAYECKKWLSANPITSRGLPQFGTGVLLNFMREVNLMKAQNFRIPAPFESSAVSGEEVTKTMLKRKRACLFCPVACGRVTSTGDGPEYETLWALGVNLSIHDLEKVTKLNNLCNELGLDSISAGVTIGMAIELSEKGLLPLAAKYGDADAVAALLEDIAGRRGAGEALSLGSRGLARMCGDEDLAPQVKGLELPAYDPEGAYGHALGYATSNRGGCHMQGYLIGAEVLGIPKLVDRFSTEGKASLLALYQNVSAFMDTLVMCRFSSNAIPHDYYARMASAVLGRKISWEDSITVGERIWNLERLFNIREGVEEDRLPQRFGKVPVKELLREYYEIRGWDKSGFPSRERLNLLGLL
jgi:aldehyde:ferredoxin oxidoreductase